MTLAAEPARSAILDVIVSKSRDACFVDWIVGLALFLYYGQAVFSHDLTAINLWPLVGALACTRAGDALKGSIERYVAGKYQQGRVNG